jgi:hypothetical protein
LKLSLDFVLIDSCQCLLHLREVAFNIGKIQGFLIPYCLLSQFGRTAIVDRFEHLLLKSFSGVTVLLLYLCFKCVYLFDNPNRFIFFVLELLIDIVVVNDLLAHQELHELQIVHNLVLHLLAQHFVAYSGAALLHPVSVPSYLLLEVGQGSSFGCLLGLPSDFYYYLIVHVLLHHSLTDLPVKTAQSGLELSQLLLFRLSHLVRQNLLQMFLLTTFSLFLQLVFILLAGLLRQVGIIGDGRSGQLLQLGFPAAKRIDLGQQVVFLDLFVLLLQGTQELGTILDLSLTETNLPLHFRSQHNLPLKPQVEILRRIFRFEADWRPLGLLRLLLHEFIFLNYNRCL